MIETYKKMWINAFNFKERTSRKDYWYVVLFNIIIIMLYFLIIGLFKESTQGLIVLLILYVIISYIPLLSIAVRRLHDINKSGWFMLLEFIPYVGGIVLLILFCFKEVEPNKYGKQV